MTATTMEKTMSDTKMWALRGDDLKHFETFKLDSDDPAGTPLYNVPITELNIFMFPNYRKKMEDIEELLDSLESQGQLQPILVTRIRHKEHTDQSCLASLAGFRRLEAYRRKAIGSLVKRFNDEKGLKPGKAEFLSFNDGDWFLKLLEVYGQEVHDLLAKVTVNCNVKYIKNRLEACYANTTENLQRLDAPIGDLIDRIFELYDMGAKRNDISKNLSIDVGSVSNYAKVGNMPYYFEAYVCTGPKYETLPDDAKADRLAMAEMLREDMVRRLHIPKTDERSLKFTTLRKLGELAMYGNDKELSDKSFSDKYLHPEVVFETLKFLCRWDNNASKINKDSPTPDLGTFTNFMSQMTTLNEALRREESGEVANLTPPETASGVALPTAGVDPDSLSLGTTETIPAGAEPEASAPVGSGDVAKAQASLAADSVDPAAGHDEDLQQDTTEATMESLVGGDEETDEGAEAVAESMTNRVTGNKPETQMRTQVDAGTVIQRAKDFSAYAEDEENHFVDRVSFFQTAAELWDLSGYQGKRDVALAKFNEYQKNVLAYLEAMETAARDAGFDMPLPVSPGVPEEMSHVLADEAEEDETLSQISSSDEDEDEEDEDFDDEENDDEENEDEDFDDEDEELEDEDDEDEEEEEEEEEEDEEASV